MSNPALITGEESLLEVRETVKQNTSVELSVAALRRFLERCNLGGLSLADLGSIADELEREPVIFEEGSEPELATVVHELSSPELRDPDSPINCAELIRYLDRG